MTEHNGNFCNFHSYVISSKDNGLTFQRKFSLPLLKGFCFIRGMIKVDDEYLFPYQHYPISQKENDYLVENNLKIWQGENNIVEMGLLRTKTFKEFEISQKPTILKLEWKDKKRWVWSEPTVVPVKDKLIMFLRYDPRGYLFKSESFDDGYTWSEPVQTDIPNPSNKPKAIKWGEKIVLLNTPQSTVGFAHRNPLAVWISQDGENWYYKKNIVKRKGWISYPDGVIKNNTLLLAFEYNRKDIYFVKRKLRK
jgi:predicted neuraminidase